MPTVITHVKAPIGSLCFPTHETTQCYSRYKLGWRRPPDSTSEYYVMSIWSIPTEVQPRLMLVVEGDRPRDAYSQLNSERLGGLIASTELASVSKGIASLITLPGDSLHSHQGRPDVLASLYVPPLLRRRRISMETTGRCMGRGGGLSILHIRQAKELCGHTKRRERWETFRIGEGFVVRVGTLCFSLSAGNSFFATANRVLKRR